VTGKLKTLCPKLYSTLSQLEIDALDASDWLKKQTNKVGVSLEVEHCGDVESRSILDKGLFSFNPMESEAQTIWSGFSLY
jgi:hypothetical protein